MSFEGVVFLPRKMWYLPVLIDLGAAGLIAQDPHTGNFSPLRGLVEQCMEVGRSDFSNVVHDKKRA